jgi:hypothetical protein
MNKDLTSVEIADLKKTYGKVSKLKITHEGKVYTGFAVKPDLKTLEAMEAITDDNTIKKLKFLATNCLKAGDPELLTEGELIIAAGKQINAMFKTATVEVEEL